MAQKMFVFDPQDLVRLLTHYTEGKVPLDAEVQNVGFNQHLDRMIGIEVTSKEFTEDWRPLHIRYDGAKIMSWTQGSGQETKDSFTLANETPKRQ